MVRSLLLSFLISAMGRQQLSANTDRRTYVSDICRTAHTAHLVDEVGQRVCRPTVHSEWGMSRFVGRTVGAINCPRKPWADDILDVMNRCNRSVDREWIMKSDTRSDVDDKCVPSLLCYTILHSIPYCEGPKSHNLIGKPWKLTTI